MGIGTLEGDARLFCLLDATDDFEELDKLLRSSFLSGSGESWESGFRGFLSSSDTF
jgi:hypothetical protein